MSLLDTNTLQVLLIEDSDMNPFDWVEEYSERFRNLVEGGVTSLDEIKFLLYQN